MDEVEKRERERQSILIKFEPFLPCTTQGCLNPATAGMASYDAAENAWLLTPLCRDCVARQAKQYGITPGE